MVLTSGSSLPTVALISGIAFPDEVNEGNSVPRKLFQNQRPPLRISWEGLHYGCVGSRG